MTTKSNLCGVALILLCLLVPTASCSKASEPNVVAPPEADGSPEREVAADAEADVRDEPTPEGCADSNGDPYATATLQARIGFLASQEMAGRFPGTEGDRRARAHIAAQFRCLGLEPAFPGYSQDVVDSEGHETANVIGFLAGSDAGVGHEIVMVMAHHDHLGVDSGEIYAGANDDASGVATMMAVAQALAAGPPPRRTVVFAAFASEEIGYDGSRWYVEHPPAALPLKNTLYVVNADMVGTYADEGKLYALDARRGTPGRSALDAVKSEFTDLEIDADEPGDVSDQVSFCEVGVPGIFFHTPDSQCYHQPCDVPDRLDYPHLARTAALVGALVTALANGEHGLGQARAAGCVPPPGDSEE